MDEGAVWVSEAERTVSGGYANVSMDWARNLATDGLHILAVTLTDAPLKPVEGKIVLCSERILAVTEPFS